MEGASSRSFNELYDKFEDVYNRLTLGRRDLKSFHEYIMLRQAAEERYVKDLEVAFKKAVNPVVVCSLSTCYSDAKDAGVQVSKHHTIMLQACKDISAELDKSIKDIKTVKTKLQDNYNRLFKDRENKKATHLKAKAVYEESVKKAEVATLSLTAGRGQAQPEKQIRKLEEAATSANKDLDKAHRAYIAAVVETQASQERFETETASMLIQFEELEKKRLATFEDTISKYVQSHVSMKNGLDELAAYLVQSQSSINAAMDIHTFICSTYTGQPPETHVEYRPKTSEIITHYGDSKAIQDSTSHMQQSQTSHSFMMRNSGNAAASAYQPGASLNSGAFGTPGTLSSPSYGSASASSAAPAGGAQAVALYEFSTQEEGDLHFKPNDIITLIMHDDADEWWQGSLNGQTGTFPRDYVKRLDKGSSGPPPAPITSAAPVAGAAPPAQSVDAFLGDTTKPTGVAAVSANNMVQMPATAGTSGRPVVKLVRGLYPFTGEEKDELSFQAGEVLSVFGEVEGWYEGALPSGQEGIFPANYVTDV